MPLPNVNEDTQCTANTRAGRRCLNLKAFGCKVCRYHGAHRTKGAAKGESHWNYKDGEQCRDKLKAERQPRKDIRDLRNLALGLGLLINPRTGKPAKTVRDLEFD